jgi:hypothetical protein
MTILAIPLEGGSVNAHQIITVQLGENLVDLNLNYLQAGQWSMNVTREGVRLFSGVMLTTNCDILQEFNVADSFGRMVVTGSKPTLDNLGIDNTLSWVSPDETF